jgi:hypothetical protein
MKYLFLIALSLSTFISYSQYDIEKAKKEQAEKEGESGSDLFAVKERTYVGGDLGLSFSSFGSYIQIAPMVGYDITDRFSGGITTMYQLIRQRNFNGDVYNFHSFGAGAFLRYRPFDQIITHVEFDMFNTNDFVNNINDRVNVPALFAGVGYANMMGDKAYYQIMLMYDFIDDPNMPLTPIIGPLYLRFGMVWYLGQ